MNFQAVLAAVAALVLLQAVAGTADGATGRPEKATFAGGCFWCMEPAFDHVPGVVSVTVGYTGGTKKDPTYEEVSSGTTGHAESIEVTYDPSKVSYKKLLDIFWHNIDPTVKDRQFCDIGHSTGARSSTITRSRSGRLKARRRHWKNRSGSAGLYTPRSCRPRLSIRPKNTTSSTTRRTLSGTSSTGGTAGGTSGSSSCGARKRPATNRQASPAGT